MKVRRGQQENALKCRSNGGVLPLGYCVSKDHTFEIVPEKAAIVREIFTRYDGGEALQAIANSLNRQGLRTQMGKEFRVSSLGKILRNRKYTGEYRYDTTVIPDGMPRIIEQDLFDRVQKRLDQNKRAPGRAKAEEEYLLTTKAFCGECGSMLVGDCGTSKTGSVYYYYKCAGRKRHNGCKLKPIKKAWLEQFVVETTVSRVFREEEMNRIADALVKLQSKEDPVIPVLEAELRECDKKLQNLMNAILAGIHTASTKEMLEQLEAQKEDLQLSITQAKLCRPVYSKDEILRWIMQFKYGSLSDPVYRRRIIDVFVNSVYIFDDKIVFTYNFKDGTDTFSLKDVTLAIHAKSSDVADSASP